MVIRINPTPAAVDRVVHGSATRMVCSKAMKEAAPENIIYVAQYRLSREDSIDRSS